MANCLAEALKRFPDADKKAIKDLHDSMTQNRRDAFVDGLANPDSAFRQKSLDTLENFQRMSTIAQIKELQNIKKMGMIKKYMADPSFANAKEGLEAMMTGTFKDVSGGRLGISLRNKTILNDLLNSFYQDMGGPKSPLMKIFMNGDLDKEIMKEVWDLEHGGKGGVSGSNEAYQIGKAYQNANKTMLYTSNNSGAFINSLEGRVMAQSHDPELLKAAGKDAWIKQVLPMLDHEKTFNRDFTPENPQKYLEKVYDNIVDGNAKLLQSNDSDQVMKIIGTPSNMAKRLEQGRKLFFKDADSMYQYTQDFGKRSMQEQLLASMRTTARTSSLMERFGTNPRATFERLIGQNKFSEAEKVDLERHWKQLDGSAGMPGNSMAAKSVQNLKQITDMSKLGLAATSKFGEFAYRAAQMQIHGENFLSGLMSSFKTFAENLPEASRSEFMRMTGVNADAMLGHIHSQVHDVDAPPGFISKTHDTVMKWTGMSQLAEAGKAGTAQQISAGIGERAKLNFSQLDPSYAKLFKKYDIGPNEWELIKRSTEEHNGVNYASYDKIKDLPDDLVKDIMDKGGMNSGGINSVGKFKNDTALKLSSWFQDRASIGVNEAGARQRAKYLNRGYNPDTAEGMAMSFMSQFHSFPVTMMSQFWDSLDKELVVQRQGKLAQAGEYTKAFAPMVLTATALGYLGVSARSMLKNETPPDPFDPKTVMESIIKGGGGGMIADLFAENRDVKSGGRSVVSSLAGPVLSQADDVFGILSNLGQGIAGNDKKMKLAAKEGVAFIGNNIPHPPILGTVIDHVLINELKETLSPGYQRRKNQRMKKSGQAPIIGE